MPLRNILKSRRSKSPLPSRDTSDQNSSGNTNQSQDSGSASNSGNTTQSSASTRLTFLLPFGRSRRSSEVPVRPPPQASCATASSAPPRPQSLNLQAYSGSTAASASAVSFASAISPSHGGVQPGSSHHDGSQAANTDPTIQVQASDSVTTLSQERRLPDPDLSRESEGRSNEILPPNCLPVIITHEPPTSTLGDRVNISETSPLTPSTVVAATPICHSHSYISPVVGQNTVAASTAAPQTTGTGLTNLGTQNPDGITSVWAKTVVITNKKLLEHSLPTLAPHNLASNSAAENIQSILKDLNTAQVDNQKRRWRYVWNGTDVIVVERWRKVLKSIEKYATVVDTAIQHHPEVTALVWACARTILQVRKIIYPLYNYYKLILDRLR